MHEEDCRLAEIIPVRWLGMEAEEGFEGHSGFDSTQALLKESLAVNQELKASLTSLLLENAEQQELLLDAGHREVSTCLTPCLCID